MSAGRAGAGRQRTAAPPAPPGIAQPPPGIGISPIVGMEGRQTIAAAAPASKTSAEMPKNVGSRVTGSLVPRTRRRHPRPGSTLVVLVVAAPSGSHCVVITILSFGCSSIRWLVVGREMDQHRASNGGSANAGSAPIGATSPVGDQLQPGRQMEGAHSKYIVAIPVNGDAFRAAAHTIPCMPSP